jgi:two-component system, LytTR family, response regulator
MRALVVEDQALSRERLIALLSAEPDVDIVGACASGQEAVDCVRRLTPDLLFLDLEIPDLDGFSILQAIGPTAPLTIVVTAHDEYAVRAFDVHAFDYLLKPFTRERLRGALDRAREQLSAGRDEQIARRLVSLVQDLGPEKPTTDRLMVKSAGRVVFIPVADIDAVESEGNYVRIHAGDRAWLVRETMTSVESRLRGERFCRVHRGWIVNLDRVKEVAVRPTGEHALVLDDGREFRVGRAYRESVQERLQLDS